MDSRIYDATVLMLSDMKEEGLHPIICSAYRTLDRQEILFNRKVKTLVKRGYTMENAYKEARHVLSIPGSGEHCLGLAVDIYSQSYQKLEERESGCGNTALNMDSFSGMTEAKKKLPGSITSRGTSGM